MEEMPACGEPDLIGPLSGRFTVVEKAIFVQEALALEGASYLTIQIEGAASVPPAAERARIELSLPVQAFVFPRPGVSVMTFKLWDKAATLALQSLLASGQSPGGRVLGWCVWNHDVEFVRCRRWNRPDPEAAARLDLAEWVEGLWRQGAMRSGTRTSSGEFLLTAILVYVALTGLTYGLYVRFRQ